MRPISVILVLLLLCLESTVSSTPYIPDSWKSKCRLKDSKAVLIPSSTSPVPSSPSQIAGDSKPLASLASTMPSTTSASTTSSSHSTDGSKSLRITLFCDVPDSAEFQWKLLDLRDWLTSRNINSNTSPSNRTVVFKLHVMCDGGAKVSVPWPMRVPGLQELYIRDCSLTDRYADYKNSHTMNQPDELKVLDIRNSVWLLGESNPFTTADGNATVIDRFTALNISSDYDCGHDSTVEIFVNRNVSDALSSLDLPGNFSKLPEDFPDFPMEFADGGISLDMQSSGPVKPEDRLVKDATKTVSEKNEFEKEQAALAALQNSMGDSTSKDAQTEFLNVLNKVLKTRTRCNYRKMRVLDESRNNLIPVFHFEFMIQESDYPVLEVMNYSMTGMRQLPRELQQWRRHFPRLKLLDLSNNKISEVKVAGYPPWGMNDVVTFDLQYNNISVINMEILREWSEVQNFYVDIRNNPIHCGCDMESSLPFFQDASTFTDAMKNYEYVRDLPCHSPQELAGETLASLTKEMLPCPEVTSSSVAPLIAMGVIMGILIIAIIILIRYKVEIRILLYTRLHIRLPCDSNIQRSSKLYDAFVSYSNEDDTWIHENLLKYLETPNSNFPKSSIVQNGKLPYSDHKSGKQGGKNSERCFRLCLHQRDFIPGKSIFDNIVDSIEASRHTIIVLSPSFMRSHWAMEELRQAYRQSLIEKTRHLIVILLEKVPKEDMDPLIKRCCKTFTYLEVQDTLFKDRLVFSLTTKDKSTQRRDRLAMKQERKNGTANGQAPNSPTSPVPSSSTFALENKAYDLDEPESNNVYSYIPHLRPSEPVRAFSNMSTSSTTALTAKQY